MISAVGPRRRILVLTSTLPRWRNDSEPRFVQDLCTHLAREADVLILAPHAPGARTEEAQDGLRIRRYRYLPERWQTLAYRGGLVARLRNNPVRILGLPFFLFALWRSVRRAMRDFRPDAIHAHWVVPQGLVACVAAGRGLPVVCTGHGSDLLLLQGFPFRFLKRWTLKRSRGVTVVSDTLAEAARDLLADVRPRVLPMGTDLASTFVPPAAGEARSDTELVFAGRLVRGKGLFVLLEAFASLLEWRPGATLTVVGDGPMRPAIEARIAASGLGERVNMTGALPHRELAAVFRRAALAVFPYTGQEGFGLVVVEAMGCGCPVLASDLPALRHSVVPGETGMLAPPGDAACLARAMRALLDDDEGRERLAAAALEHVRREFDWPVIAGRYRQLLESCITGA